jgi:hypothetical protein
MGRRDVRRSRAVFAPSYFQKDHPEYVVSPIKGKVDDRRRVEGEYLADNESANDGDAEGPRSSEPTPRPVPKEGPSRAAIVVIMIGRNRKRQAW